MMSIGQRIKECRELLKMTQESLANKIGTTKQTIYKYENDIITNIPSDKIELIAKALAISPAYLMGWINNDGDSITDYYYDTIEFLLNFLKEKGYTPIETNTGDYIILDKNEQIVTKISEGELIHKYEHIRILKAKLTASKLLGLEALSSDPDLTGVTNISFPASRPIPILGDICAGEGTWCEENFEGHFFIDSSVKADFCVRVRGDSMIDAGIFNGDLAFIKKTYDYTNGKIYAVRINSDCEAVLKKVFWQEDTIILNPCNADYEPIVTDAEGMTVIGECVGVFHSTISMF